MSNSNNPCVDKSLTSVVQCSNSDDGFKGLWIATIACVVLTVVIFIAQSMKKANLDKAINQM